MKNSVKKGMQLVIGLVIAFSFVQCNKAETKITDTPLSSKTTAVNQFDEATSAEASTESMETVIECIYTCLNAMPIEELSEAEINTLTFMREEELLAHDIYVFMYNAYNLPVFNNISKSETIHSIAMKAMLEKYGLTDPAASHEPGVFANPAIQELYNGLLTQGLLSINDALVVGETIEDYDIADIISHLSEGIDNQDVLFVLEQLNKGSRNHMRAFYAHLQYRDITYTPQFVSIDIYNQIVSSDWEVGTGFCVCNCSQTNSLENAQTE